MTSKANQGGTVVVNEFIDDRQLFRLGLVQPRGRVPVGLSEVGAAVKQWLDSNACVAHVTITDHTIVLMLPNAGAVAVSMLQSGVIRALGALGVTTAEQSLFRRQNSVVISAEASDTENFNPRDWFQLQFRLALDSSNRGGFEFLELPIESCIVQAYWKNNDYQVHAVPGMYAVAQLLQNGPFGSEHSLVQSCAAATKSLSGKEFWLIGDYGVERFNLNL